MQQITGNVDWQIRIGQYWTVQSGGGIRELHSLSVVVHLVDSRIHMKDISSVVMWLAHVFVVTASDWLL